MWSERGSHTLPAVGGLVCSPGLAALKALFLRFVTVPCVQPPDSRCPTPSLVDRSQAWNSRIQC